MVHEKELACVIAELHFGEDAGAVSRMLLMHPGIGVAELSRHSKLSPERCRAALRVLMQHGATYSATTMETLEADGADTYKSITIYQMHLLPLLMRTRQALYERLVEKEYGELGRKVLHELFLRGRMTSTALCKHALDPCVEELGIDKDAAISLLMDMARDGVIIWCGNRRAGIKSSELIICDHHHVSDDDDELMTNGHTNKIMVGKGGNRRMVGAPTRDNDSDVWRLSFWYLNRSFRNEACRMVLSSRLPDRPLVLDILVTGLSIALSREDPMRPTDDFETCEISIEEIRTTLIDNAYKLDGKLFWEAIKTLITITPACVYGMPAAAPSTLRFVPGRLVSEVRFQTLAEYVSNRYGAAAKRIFMALAKEGAMDDALVSKKCMLDAKTVREKCWAMKRDKFIDMQEVPRSHETATRQSNWYYFWNVQPKETADAFLQTVYKTQTNVLLRKMALNEKKKNAAEHIIGKEKRTNQKMKQEGETNGNGKNESGSGNNNNKAFDEEMKEKQNRLLAVSSMRLDQSIMVMRDFGTFTNRFLRANYQLNDPPDKRVL